LEEKAVRQEKKVIRMRQNTTDKPGKEEEEEEEAEFKKEIPGEYHDTIFDKKIFDKLPS